MYRIIIITLLSLAILKAEDISGKVAGLSEEGKSEPLSGASVHWKETNAGTITDKNGNFKLKKTNKAKTLITAYIGYKPDTTLISESVSGLEIKLKPNFRTDEIIVAGAQPGRIVNQANIIKSESITARGLQKAACCNLSESFQTNPSIDVSFTNAVTGAKQIQMLGLQGVYIQILNEQTPALHGLTTNLGLDFIPGPWMESIQISKGLASVTSGFESISGQINIEYKKPDKIEPLFLNVYANQQGRYEGNLVSGMKLSDKLSTGIFGHASFNVNKLDINSDGFLDKPLSQQLNFMNRWTYRDDNFISQTSLKAMLDEKNGGQLNYWPNKDTNYYGMQIKSRRFEVVSKNGFVFPGKIYSSLGTVLLFSHYKLESFFDKLIYNAEQNSFQAKAMYQSEIGDSTNKYTVGVSYSLDNFIEHIKIFHEPKWESIPGAFVEYTFSGIPNLTLMAGLRIDLPAGQSTQKDTVTNTLVLRDTKFETFITPRFHLSYRINENHSLRASAGKGYRIANIHAEDIGMFASSRAMFMDEIQRPEEAWNYGINTSSQFSLFGLDFTLNLEYYRTDFINQILMDMEKSPTEMHIYNLKGKSYSNSFQADLMFDPYPGFTITTAYRLNDVKMTINGILYDKALQSREKGFLNIAYSTVNDDWNFDFTGEYNGSGRIPPTSTNPVGFRMEERFDPFFLLHAQITKRFERFDLYLGGENLTDFRQKYAIISADNPKGPYFEGALIWGPVIGRVIYAGARYRFL